MKVLFLSPVGEVGGAERLMLDLMSSLRAAEPQWHLALICAAAGPLQEAAQALGVDARVVPLPASVASLGETGGAAARAAALLDMLRYLPLLRRAMRAARPDIVHSNGLKMHVLAALSRPDAPLLWHIHDFIGSRPLMRRALRALRGRCARAIAISAAVARDSEQSWASGARVPVLLNATDLARFTADGPGLDLDGLAGIEPPRGPIVRVGLVATFGRPKGHETFLRAIAALPRDVNVRAYVVGGPVYHTAGSQVTLVQLQTLAAALGISDRVGFTGFVDTAAAMRSLDVVVHASTAPEPFGLVIVEAMACGRAVIASNAGGVVEIVTPGVDALVHEPGDVDGLRDAILQLVRDAGLRARLGSNARAAAVARFDAQRMGPEAAAIYRDVVAGRR